MKKSIMRINTEYLQEALESSGSEPSKDDENIRRQIYDSINNFLGGRVTVQDGDYTTRETRPARSENR